MNRSACVASLTLSLALAGCDSAGDSKGDKPGKSAEAEKDDAQTVAVPDDPTRKPDAGNDPQGAALRAKSVAALEAAGFKVAKTLPTRAQRTQVPGTLRPAEEIAGRAMALKAVYMWCSAPQDAVPSAKIETYVETNELTKFMDDDERSIMALPRAEAAKKHGPTIGWRLENLWALAWILGYDKEPAADGATIPVEVTQSLVLGFVPKLDASREQWVQQAKLRSQEEVAALEDLFYCAHNAGRSAQNDSPDAVPKGFDATTGTGVIHERRHALTWALSPGTAWDDTDLST